MASEELAIYVRMKDFASKEASSISKAISGISSHVFNLKNALLGLAGGFGAVKLIDTAVEVEEVENSFNNLSKAIGGPKAALEGLRKGVSDTVSDMELMRLGNEALMKGVASSATEMEYLATVAHELGKAIGFEAAPALDQLISGLASKNARSLRSLGIIVDNTEAEEKYAKALGTTREKLTESAKDMAFRNEVFEKASKIMQDMGPEVKTLGDAWGGFKAQLANLGQDILRDMTPMLRDAFNDMIKFVKDNRDAVRDFFRDFLMAVRESAPGIISMLRDVTSALMDLLRAFADVSKIIGLGSSKGRQESTQAAAWMAVRKAIQSRMPWQEGPNFGVFGSGKYQERVELTPWAQGPNETIEQWSERVVEKGLVTRAELTKEGVYTAIAEMQEARTAHDRLMALYQYVLMPSKAFGGSAGGPKYEWQGPEQSRLDFIKAEGEGAVAKNAAELEAHKEPWAEEQNKWEEEYTLIGGAKKKLTEFKDEFQKLGVTAGLALEQIGGAISSNLGDAFTALITGTKSAKQAFTDMARSMINDIVRITMQLMSMTIVKGLFGLAVLGEGGIVPGHLSPRVRGRFAGGSIAGMHGFYELAERGQPEAVIPLRGGAVPVKMLGGRRGGSVVQNIVNVTLNSKSYSSSEERALLLRNAKDIGNIVVQKMQTSFRFREGMAA